MRVLHQNESCFACPHPPSSYGGRREQEGSSHFDSGIYQGPDCFNQIEVASFHLLNIIFLSHLFQTTRLCNLQLKSVQVDDGCEESYQGDERGDARNRELPRLLLERTQQERQLVRRSLQSPSSVR